LLEAILAKFTRILTLARSYSNTLFVSTDLIKKQHVTITRDRSSIKDIWSMAYSTVGTAKPLAKL
jgi:hypothetical protein